MMCLCTMKLNNSASGSVHNLKQLLSWQRCGRELLDINQVLKKQNMKYTEHMCKPVDLKNNNNGHWLRGVNKHSMFTQCRSVLGSPPLSPKEQHYFGEHCVFASIPSTRGRVETLAFRTYHTLFPFRKMGNLKWFVEPDQLSLYCSSIYNVVSSVKFGCKINLIINNFLNFLFFVSASIHKERDDWHGNCWRECPAHTDHMDGHWARERFQ